LLDRLLDLEPERHEALVAADELGISGAARFIRHEDASSTPEVAIIVADDWQHQRAALLLLLLLDRLKFR
jgi:hypothetical protein